MHNVSTTHLNRSIYWEIQEFSPEYLPFGYGLRKDAQGATSQREGQGELRGKPHRSNRCGASVAYEDQHLRRHEDTPIGLAWMFYEWQRL